MNILTAFVLPEPNLYIYPKYMLSSNTFSVLPDDRAHLYVKLWVATIKILSWFCFVFDLLSIYNALQ